MIIGTFLYFENRHWNFFKFYFFFFHNWTPLRFKLDIALSHEHRKKRLIYFIFFIILFDFSLSIFNISSGIIPVDIIKPPLTTPRTSRKKPQRFGYSWLWGGFFFPVWRKISMQMSWMGSSYPWNAGQNNASAENTERESYNTSP